MKMSDEKIIEWGLENGFITNENLDKDDTIIIDCLKGIYKLQHGELEVLHQKKDGTPWVGYLHESYEEAMERQNDVLNQSIELSSFDKYINEHPEAFMKK